MCSICDAQTLADHRHDHHHDHLVDTAIRERGWTIQTVGGGDPHEPPPSAPWLPATWAYTIGLTERVLCPELVVLGLEPGVASSLLTAVGALVVRGLNLEAAAWRLDCGMVPVHEDVLRTELVAQWCRYYRTTPLVGDFVQLLAPAYVGGAAGPPTVRLDQPPERLLAAHTRSRRRAHRHLN
jgi:hypothetical protein